MGNGERARARMQNIHRIIVVVVIVSFPFAFSFRQMRLIRGTISIEGIQRLATVRTHALSRSLSTHYYYYQHSGP